MNIAHYINRIAKNSFWLGFGNFSQKLSVFICTIIITRFYSASDFGRIMYCISIVTFFAMLSDMGLSPIGTRDMSRLEEKESYWNKIFTLRICFAPISIIGWLFLLVFNSKIPGVLLLATVSLLYCSLLSLSDFLCTRYRAQEKMQFEAAGKALGGVLMIGSVFALAAAKSSIGITFMGFFLSSSVAFLFLLLSLTRLKGFPAFHYDIAFIKKTLRQSMPIAGSFLLFYAFSRIDSFFVYNLIGEESNGYYQICVSLVFTIAFMVSFLFQASFPIMSKKMSYRHPRWRIGLVSTVCFFLIGVCFYLVFYFFGDFIIAKVYGPNFSQSAEIMKYYGLFLPSFMGLSFLSYYFVVLGKQVLNLAVYGLLSAMAPAIYVSAKLGGVNGVALSVSTIGFVGFLAGFLMLGLLARKYKKEAALM